MSFQRKLVKRQSKYKNILKKDYGILTDNKPSKNLMVCNAGLVNCYDRENMLDVFKNYGQVDTIVMPEGKSYSFVGFQNEMNATSCFHDINGTYILPCINGPLYLLYVNEIPEVDYPNNFSEFPPGLHLIDNFLNEDEESKLINCVSFDDSNSIGEMKNRVVKHFGYEFLYGCNNINKSSPMERKIPEECNAIFDRIRDKGLSHLVPWIPDQLTVNHYRPGQGIPPHIDTHSAFEDPIISISLGSDVVMDFKSDNRILSVILPRRSLLIISGESRFAWSHGICPRKSDVIPHPDGGLTSKKRETRISLTFRRIRHTPCECPYANFCDSQVNKCDITDDMATSLENTYVHEVYNKISDHFSLTRHKPWANVLEFVKSFPSGSLLVDVGCGNGKYFGHSKNNFELGLDQCSNLVEICRNRGYEALVCNCLALPLRSNVSDGVICIAVIHHLATPARRIHAIKEMIRIIRIGGKILIYAWAKNQTKNNKKSSYIKQHTKNNQEKDEKTLYKSNEVEIEGMSSTSEKFNLKLPLHENRTSFQHQDLLVPWKLKLEKNQSSFPTYHRFYHVFEENELEELCKTIDSTIIEQSYYDQGNWCVILKKIK